MASARSVVPVKAAGGTEGLGLDGCGSGRAILRVGNSGIMERMIADLDELRLRIATLPDEEQAAAIFALAVIENGLADEVVDRPSARGESAASSTG